MRKLLVWDMDGVLVKLTEKFCQIANALAEDEIITPEKLTRYRLENYYPRDIFDSVFTSRELWMGAEEDKPVFDIFKRYIGDSIVASIPYHPESAWWKYLWLTNRGVDPKKIALMGEKSYLASSGRLIIDDNPSKCASFFEAGGECILYVQPYSGDCTYFTEKELEIAWSRTARSPEELEKKIHEFLSSQ